jgi:16S rRNA processing protein RimM
MKNVPGLKSWNKAMPDAHAFKKDLVLVGKVTKAHSLRGEIKVHAFSGSPEMLVQYSEMFLVSKNCTAPVLHQIERARIQKNAVLLQLKGCTDRNAAEQLVQAQVYVHEDALPEPEPDEFYLRELEGKLLKTQDGQTIGRIHSFLTNSMQDILRVKENGEEYLIPLIPEFLQAVTQDEVTVSLPPGLLEINS